MKKRRIYCFSLLVLIFFACQNIDQPSKPEHLISEQKMAEILTDIAFVKSAKSSYKKIFDTEKINPVSYILKKHGIDSIIFAENNSWYANNLNEYDSIFKIVKMNLEKSKVTFEKLKKEEDSIRKIEDSIKKAAKNTTLSKEKIPQDDLEELESIEEELEE